MPLPPLVGCTVLPALGPRLVEIVTGGRQLISSATKLKPECTSGLTPCAVSGSERPGSACDTTLHGVRRCCSVTDHRHFSSEYYSLNIEFL